MRWIYLLVAALGVAGCTSARQAHVCRYNYTFTNPSLGPVHGMQHVIMEIDGTQIVSATDPKNQTSIPLNQVKGVETLSDALIHKGNDLEVTYDGQVPVAIRKKAKIGNSYTIKLSKIDCK